ncbi:unnamed protein product [Brugia pahangi]|uniref:Uncharacterized protein n=1 Tax=Brugia pahangi TaxID=6280 RepID=A0A0N4TJI8_BRUPA|nr:unnamed protein product [Brugia pahangi]
MKMTKEMTTQAEYSTLCVTQKETRSAHLTLGALLSEPVPVNREWTRASCCCCCCCCCYNMTTTAAAAIDMKVVEVAELSMAPSTKSRVRSLPSGVLLAPLAPPPPSSSAAAALAPAAAATAMAETALETEYSVKAERMAYIVLSCMAC